MAALPTRAIKLLVVGNDAAEPFRVRATQLGVQDRCQWELPAPDVIDFYAAADLYISPSLEDSFALPAAEAMACGLPVITSTFAGVADFVQDGVDAWVLREPRDARVVAEIIQQLQDDAKLRRAMGEAAARKALDWSWDRHAEAVWELLRSAGARSRHHHDI